MEKDKLIDLRHLEQVCGGNKAMALKMMELFVQQTPDQISKMKQFTAQQNWSELFTVVHKVKSSLAIMGVKPRKAAVIKLENDTKNEINLDEIPATVDKVIGVCNLVLKEIEGEYSDLNK